MSATKQQPVQSVKTETLAVSAVTWNHIKSDVGLHVPVHSGVQLIWALLMEGIDIFRLEMLEDDIRYHSNRRILAKSSIPYYNTEGKNGNMHIESVNVVNLGAAEEEADCCETHYVLAVLHHNEEHFISLISGPLSPLS